MAQSMLRALYRGLLYLHPPAFRKRFAEEMLWIFDEAAATRGTLGLFGDGLVSLLRQWIVRPESWHAPLAAIGPARAGSSALFAWEHFEVPQDRLPFYRWMQGSVISLGMLSAVLLMAGQGVRARQLRQQEKAIQVAIGGRSVPGSLRYFPAGSRAAAVETPKTPAGEQFSAWLKSFNSGDRAQMEEILTRFKDRGGREVNGMLGFRERTGGFDLRKIEESAALRVSGLLQERDSDQFARFTMDVEAEAPHKITRFDLNAVPRPVEFPIDRMSQRDLLAALPDRLDKDSVADKFAGAVIVAKDGKVVFKGAYGMADREKKTPNTLDTKFRIGSMNKMFTATSILQLVQAGKIALAD